MRTVRSRTLSRSRNQALCHGTLYFDDDRRDYGIVGCAVGAPYAVLVAEQLFASGCRLLLSITSSGQVTTLGSPPYFILIERALRDEAQAIIIWPPGPNMPRPIRLCCRSSWRRWPRSAIRWSAVRRGRLMRPTGNARGYRRGAGRRHSGCRNGGGRPLRVRRGTLQASALLRACYQSDGSIRGLREGGGQWRDCVARARPCRRRGLPGYADLPFPYSTRARRISNRTRYNSMTENRSPFCHVP